jgi:hypothetical protein
MRRLSVVNRQKRRNTAPSESDVPRKATSLEYDTINTLIEHRRVKKIQVVYKKWNSKNK